jgi:MFS family permease
LALPGQLFNIYYVRTLHTTDGWLGLNSAAANLGVIIGYIAWERLLRKHSFFWGQRRASLLTWIFPLTLALFTDLNIIIFGNFLVNLMHPGFDLSNLNVLLKLSPPEDRPTYVSWFNVVINVSAFAGPIVGALLADRFGIPGVLMLSAALRVVGGILYNTNRVEDRAGAVPAPAQ